MTEYILHLWPSKLGLEARRSTRHRRNLTTIQRYSRL